MIKKDFLQIIKFDWKIFYVLYRKNNKNFLIKNIELYQLTCLYWDEVVKNLNLFENLKYLLILIHSNAFTDYNFKILKKY